MTAALLCLVMMLTASCSGDVATSDSDTASADTTVAETTTEAETATATETEPTSNLKFNRDDPDFYILHIDADEEVDFTNAPKAHLDIWRWGKSFYAPVTYGQIVFREGDGFYVRMECEETDPRAVNTEFNGPIYEDSCMEFFAQYKHGISKKYVNIEMNANGAFLCYFCNSINDNVTIDTVTENIPTCESFKTDTIWGVNLYVPLAMLDDIYGGDTLTLGDTIMMNFYKCGNKCDPPHYGMWNDVPLEKANFHVPQYFAEVEIRKP